MSDYYFKAGDTRPTIVRVLEQPDGTPLNLTDATSVEFRLAREDKTPVFQRAAVIESAAEGEVSFTFAAEDTDDHGAYLGEFVVFWGEEKTDPQTLPSNGQLTIEIERALK